MNAAPISHGVVPARGVRGAVRVGLLIAVGAGFLGGFLATGMLDGQELPIIGSRSSGHGDAPGDEERIDSARHIQKLTDQLEAAEADRDRLTADTNRLRGELLAAHRRIESLADTVGKVTELAGRAAEAPATISRTSERHGDPRSQGINLALRASGIHDLAVVELLSLQDGVARGLMVTGVDERGIPAAADHWDRARISLSQGLARLVLERDPDAELGPDGEPVPMAVERREVPMPEVDAQAWDDAGLPLPEAALTVGRARQALQELILFQNLEVISLGGVRGEELLDVELREVDAGGRTLRVFRAGRVQVQPDGPALLLLDGEVEVEGDVRSFWRGSTRLPLPGASYGAWLTALFG